VTSSAIEIRGVSKQFRRHRQVPVTLRERLTRRSQPQPDTFWALRDIDVDIAAGKTFAFMGDNGSGKSTLLKLIAGIHRPTAGSIHTTGRLSALLELAAGFHPDLTGRENVFLNGTILGLSRKDLESRLDAIVSFSGIEDFIDSPVKYYSSGMLLRLAFAVAVHVEPEILLVDEILAVGDLEFQRKCTEHLYRLRQAGTTVVLVSHDLATLRDMCDQALWLDHGRAVRIGPVSEVADAYIAAVNQRSDEETRQSGNVTAVELDTHPVLGSGEIRLTSVEFRRDGQIVGAGLTGSPLTIRLNYQCETSLDAADFTLSVHHESGAVIAQPKSSADGPSLRIPAGDGHVDFRMDDLMLAPGLYQLSTAISHQGHAFDWRDRRYEFPVHGAGPEVHGLVRLPGRWTITSHTGEYPS